ncbi:MAG: tRNA epoxyqueuosine(34) reductase QueG [Proteobacteria bacterium]|nr:MAG: tRNA epoxyqueuosine(34) reductase QueG [Pseudomonadota bacterium]
MPEEQLFNIEELSDSIHRWAGELGFQRLGISDIDLHKQEPQLQNWLRAGYHGEMHYMSKHGMKRVRPAELVPGTLCVISVRMDYLPESVAAAEQALCQRESGYISRYALGRDYHKVLRKRLQKLATKIESIIGPFSYRVFVDSAPVMEKPIAQKAGLGWVGKHTNIIDKEDGSFFFLGEIYTDLPLKPDSPAKNHCGSCSACIDVCPTQAIVAPYQLDARRCISYLTIEHPGSIAEEFRPAIGNRIYGCDDCQLVCPWNRFAKLGAEANFVSRSELGSPRLTTLFRWTEEEFLRNTEGNPIRRIGHERWLRNIAIALGNAPPSQAAREALLFGTRSASELVREHSTWGLLQQGIGRSRL